MEKHCKASLNKTALVTARDAGPVLCLSFEEKKNVLVLIFKTKTFWRHWSENVNLLDHYGRPLHIPF